MLESDLLHKRLRRQRRVRYALRMHNRQNVPRLSVFKSNSNLYAQIIDDHKHCTLLSMSTLDRDFRKIFSQNKRSKCRSFGNRIHAEKLGKDLAEQAKKRNITSVVFDRGRYLYHGVIKAFGDAARSHGLNF